MKKYFFLLLLIFNFIFSKLECFAQVAINSTGDMPDSSSMLDVNSASKGILIPRVALISINDVITVPAPVVSLLVYNTGAGGLSPSGFYYWDGSKWVNLINSQGITELVCPIGFISVDSLFCIEIDEHPATDWFSAVVICHNLGGRLCNYEEWYYACQSGLPLINMVGNWEWTGDATTGTSMRIVGNTNCTNASSNTSTSILFFRCCCCGK